MHDGRASENHYLQDCRADKDSYPHANRNVTDDLCSLI